ncbi:solute carrier family 15 member 2-like [Lithobates pipiens]
MGAGTGVRKFFSRDSVPTKKVPRICGTNYPLSIMFIIVNEFCERFAYYGMKAVLTLYFLNYLGWDRNRSTTIYHAFSGLCYFTPLIGAPIADAWLGKFNTIFWLSILYVFGYVIESVGAIPSIGNKDLHVVLSMIGLIAIAFGTGTIKPCIPAFGGDQFDAEHVKERGKFFSIFYMAINAGSLISTFVTPILRGDVQCFGQDCYALAFGVPAAFMFFAVVVFVSGSGMYRKYPPQGNILAQVFKCIGFAIKNRWRHRSNQFPKRGHWLDWASENYSKKLITEVKMVTKVLFLYIPFPMFWALYDQQGSRWTLQATRMNADFTAFVIQPDQIQVLNSVLNLILVPVFDLGIYPLIKLCKINFHPIAKMAIGMLLAALAFAVATVVEVKINETNPLVPKAGEATLQVLNFANQGVTVRVPNNSPFTQPSLIVGDFQDPNYVKVNFTGTTNVNVEIGVQSISCSDIREEATYSLLVDTNTDGSLYCRKIEDPNNKPENGLAGVRFVNLLPEPVYNIHIADATINVTNNDISEYLTQKRALTKLAVTYKGAEHTIDLDLLDFGAAYTAVLKGVDDTKKEIKAYKVEDIDANSVHVAWQIPQYVLLSAGEVMFSVTCLDFSYAQAPASMKSILQAGWLLTVAFGNVIVLIVAEAGSMEQWAEFILFGALLVAVSIIFSIMGYYFVPVDPNDLIEDEDTDDDLKKPIPDFYETGIDNIEEKKTKI